MCADVQNAKRGLGRTQHEKPGGRLLDWLSERRDEQERPDTALRRGCLSAGMSVSGIASRLAVGHGLLPAWSDDRWCPWRGLQATQAESFMRGGQARFLDVGRANFRAARKSIRFAGEPYISRATLYCSALSFPWRASSPVPAPIRGAGLCSGELHLMAGV